MLQILCLRNTAELLHCKRRAETSLSYWREFGRSHKGSGIIDCIEQWYYDSMSCVLSLVSAVSIFRWSDKIQGSLPPESSAPAEESGQGGMIPFHIGLGLVSRTFDHPAFIRGYSLLDQQSGPHSSDRNVNRLTYSHQRTHTATSNGGNSLVHGSICVSR